MTIAADQLAPPEHGRDRILRVAAELFLSHGYAETSLRSIAEAAEMRPASIYHHFESKDALLGEILNIGMEAVTNSFTTVDAGLAADVDDRGRLEVHVAGHLSALFANHAFTAAHVTVFPFVPDEVRSTSVAQRDQYEAKWAALLADLVPQLSPEALRLARLTLFGAMNSTVHWFDPTEGTISDLAASIVDTVWQGLAHAKDES